jgi:hypothetical protein
MHGSDRCRRRLADSLLFRHLHSPLWDHAYFYVKHRSLESGKYFSSGWGSFNAIESVRRHFCAPLEANPADVQWAANWESTDLYRYRDGYFPSPRFQEFLPDESRLERFRLVLPYGVPTPPIYIVMATTAEEGYASRLLDFSEPLALRGVGTMLLEHPFLGVRRPPSQATSKLNHVSDLLLEGGAVVEEARSLLLYLYDSGFKKLGVAGISKGGHHAALVASLCQIELSSVTLVAPHSGIPVFTEGLFSRLVDWNALGAKSSDELSMKAKLRDILAFTSIEHLPPPTYDSRLVTLAARHDKVVPRYSFETYARHWKNSTIHWLRGGHVSSIAFHKETMRNAMIKAIF